MQPERIPPATPERSAQAGEAAPAQADVLAALLARPQAQTASPQPSEIVVGWLRGLAAGGQALVEWPGGPTAPTAASSLVAVSATDVGRSVALGFPAGAGQPLILGLVWSPAAEPVAVEVDGRHLEIAAEESITLRCGQASITLTADGQVLLRGTYVSSHSSGTQRIKGAAVRIN